MLDVCVVCLKFRDVHVAMCPCRIEQTSTWMLAVVSHRGASNCSSGEGIHDQTTVTVKADSDGGVEGGDSLRERERIDLSWWSFHHTSLAWASAAIGTPAAMEAHKEAILSQPESLLESGQYHIGRPRPSSS